VTSHYVLEGTIVTAFDDEPEETITAGRSLKDKASFHRVSRNGSQTEPMRFLIAYTVKTVSQTPHGSISKQGRGPPCSRVPFSMVSNGVL
jgi:hypothetical protein